MKGETRRKFLVKSMTSLGSLLPFLYSCEGRGARGGPLGPTASGIFTLPVLAPSPIIVIPGSVKLIKGGTQSFTVSGGSETFTWSVSNSSLGSIDISTGVFTAGITTGTLGIQATDSLGAVGSATVTIIAATIILTPEGITIPNSVTVPFTTTFTASGGKSPYFYTMSIGSTYIGTSMALTTGVLTVTTIPTVVEGNQSITVTATDSNGDTDTTELTLESA